MKACKGLWVALLFAPQLLGQTSLPIQSTNKAEARELVEEINSIRSYCQDVTNDSMSHVPRLFAKSIATGSWNEFSSRAEWERAGKPQPAAFAWYKENKLIRAVLVFNDGGARNADYCYRTDGHLAYLRSEAKPSAVCDGAYFRCQLTLAREWLYLPKGQIVSVMFDDPRPLKSERTTFSLLRKPTEYLSIWELPFGN